MCVCVYSPLLLRMYLHREGISRCPLYAIHSSMLVHDDDLPTVSPSSLHINVHPPFFSTLHQSKMPAEDEAPKGEGGKDISLSIEETNKLRAKLGLRALDVEEKKEEKKGSSKAPINYMEHLQEQEEEKKTKEIQEKIQEMKKVREVSKKVLAKKGLGDSSDDEEGLDHAAKWVQRSRKKQTEAAAKHAQRMQEEEEQAEQQASQSAYYNSNIYV